MYELEFYTQPNYQIMCKSIIRCFLVDMETAVRATRVVLIRDDGALGQGALSTRISYQE